jgi:hypothetical protein
VRVCRSRLDDFLPLFNEASVADRVLHVQPPSAGWFSLIFRRWHCQSCTLFSPLRFKVLLAIINLSVHVWSPETVQSIIDTSCLSFEIVPASPEQRGSLLVLRGRLDYPPKPDSS